ncbi:hypothetical protein KPL71_004359 [Citrus sinensis]|uniref:Uncharacterized protein n=1 Tax=Citrus sinensis TaxID=2711 RepID=A0ACB8N510_CITSI|nr:hypothetical protein KPL71_004359 [Citrus sinensis]
MARLVLVSLFIVAEILMVQAVADKSEVNPVGFNKPEPARAPEIRRLGKHHQHHSDKSVAGGGVIIGGLVTAIFAAVFCYIRVTRKRHGADAN